MARDKILMGAVLAVLAAGGSAVPLAAPPVSSAARGPQSQVDAGIVAARARNTALQAQVTELEQHNAAARKQLDARDAKIAELERRLDAAGAPASATSAGH